MNLIADDGYSMLTTDVTHALKLLSLPNSSARVVRVAEEEEGGLLVGALCLEVLPVHLECVIDTLERTLQYFTSVVSDAGAETVVGRR